MALRRTLAVLALVTAATSAVWFKFDSPATGIDDANIFLAYARNISAGQGFVFNSGGERVEGFTSFLWVIVSSLVVALSDQPERVLLLFNIVLVVVTISFCLRSSVLSTQKDTLSYWAMAFVILLLSDFFFVAWSTVTLMETALWGVLLTLAALMAIESGEKPPRTSVFAVVIAVMTLTRPEALVWAPAIIALLYVRRASIAGHIPALKHATPALVAYATTAASLTAFRLAYFGYPLPNTYYAKVAPSLVYRLEEGAKYLRSYVTSGAIPFLCVVAIVISTVICAKARFRDTKTLALNVIAIVALIVPVLSGGDHFDGFRFYQPVYPILLLNLLNCARVVVSGVSPGLKSKTRPTYVARVLPFGPATPTNTAQLVVAAVLLGLFISLRTVEWVYVDYRAVLGYEFDIAANGRHRGKQANVLFEALQSRPSIGTITVGGLKYAYEGDVVDLMGLNNTRIAHNGGSRVGLRSHAAFEKRTFYELRPTMVVPLVQFSEGVSSMDAKNSMSSAMTAIILKGLLDDPEFRRKYQVAEVKKATPGGVVAVAAWYDRIFLAELSRSGDFEILAKP